jgi:hypothetical protein
VNSHRAFELLSELETLHAVEAALCEGLMLCRRHLLAEVTRFREFVVLVTSPRSNILHSKSSQMCSLVPNDMNEGAPDPSRVAIALLPIVSCHIYSVRTEGAGPEGGLLLYSSFVSLVTSTLASSHIVYS